VLKDPSFQGGNALEPLRRKPRPLRKSGKSLGFQDNSGKRPR
jgi:hypothetical protein